MRRKFFSIFLALVVLIAAATLASQAEAAKLTGIQVIALGRDTFGNWIQIPYPHRNFPPNQLVRGKELFIRVIFDGTPAGVIFTCNGVDIQQDAVKKNKTYHSMKGSRAEYSVSFKDMGFSPGECIISSFYVTAYDYTGKKYHGYVTGIKADIKE